MRTICTTKRFHGIAECSCGKDATHVVLWGNKINPDKITYTCDSCNEIMEGCFERGN